uniref:Uncharacterized protein n=1 Tax=Chromera velia CCMP2878 TaxID=1169474 RepID=A0A0G4HEL2_9ALVE|mmetsp:Transcript_32254/g.64019  ORF Transcript_32254/g.64019 Transcript_32254/m.64019 type:complete len:137 (-) Transcript_32254:487-897(-)|eukprot:Cvel_26794.t1-p1 / transcript=Cvel_26794.t1 / gene=Cvel_26794 / organism=Chromera_velia_CCMP2878 / gene_product=hypothetical protein / transcript_product=hypothetical protein / location=Cvel_scaffold3244:2424-3471(-) / protein_length=136 / sequence_SO=supercontig / SO=protein_coding / is_pseudo=false
MEQISRKMAHMTANMYRTGTLSHNEWRDKTDHLVTSALFQGSKKDPTLLSTHAATRYLKPRMSESLVKEQMATNKQFASQMTQTFLHDGETPLNSGCPVMNGHASGQVKGRIEGDLHSRNTNPGYARNALGGFYTG